MGIAIAIALLGALFVTDNQEFFDKVETDIIGSDSISNSTDSVDNKKLIEINETIRYHSIEIIGDELRQYMTSMKTAI